MKKENYLIEKIGNCYLLKYGHWENGHFNYRSLGDIIEFNGMFAVKLHNDEKVVNIEKSLEDAINNTSFGSDDLSMGDFIYCKYPFELVRGYNEYLRSETDGYPSLEIMIKQFDDVAELALTYCHSYKVNLFLFADKCKRDDFTTERRYKIFMNLIKDIKRHDSMFMYLEDLSELYDIAYEYQKPLSNYSDRKKQIGTLLGYDYKRRIGYKDVNELFFVNLLSNGDNILDG